MRIMTKNGMPALLVARGGVCLLALCVLVLSIATVVATLPSTSLPAGPERACCAQMAHDAGHGPPQPSRGMTGSCCNLPVCVSLFLQTGEVRLDPGCAEIKWDSYAAAAQSLSERPPVPPPRV